MTKDLTKEIEDKLKQLEETLERHRFFLKEIKYMVVKEHDGDSNE